MRSPTRHLAAVLVLAVVTLLGYANSFRGGFPLDNKALILQDTRVHAATRANVDLILNHTYWWPIGESGLYRPVTTLSYLFNYAVLGNGDRSAGYHAFNLVLHVFNVLLLYFLSRRLLRDDGLAVAIAALWAVHPLSTEAVTNIVGRADLIAACAVIGGLLIYIRSCETIGALRILWLVALAVMTTLGVFAKESAVVIVGVIVLHAVIVPVSARGEPVEPRASRRARPSTGSGRAKWWALLALVVPVLLLWHQRSIVLGAAPSAEFPFVDNPIAGAGFRIGTLTAVGVMARYLWLMIWPAALSPDYSYAQIPLATGGGQDWLAWAVVAAAAAAITVMFRLRHERESFFFAAFAFITFLPASNLLFATGTIMAERVMYLPSAGLVALGVLMLERAARRAGLPVLSILVITAIVAVCGARTWKRNLDWQNDVTLWASAVDAAPRSFKAHRALAEALYEEDPTHANLARVIDEIEKSVNILAPLSDARNDARTYRQAGAYYLEYGDLLRGRAPRPAAPAPADSRRAYERAVPVLLRSLAIIDASRGSSTARPRADVYRVLSAVYTRLDDTSNAIEAAARARDLEPESPVSYQQAAAALLAASRGDEAAVMLMVGLMVTRNSALRDELVDLYRQGLDPLGCAIVSTPSGAAINPSCATVRRHVCAATIDAVKIHQRAGRVEEARRLQDSAARQFQCS